jgi:hypothetical protein
MNIFNLFKRKQENTNASDTTLKGLTAVIKGKGHKEYSFLHPTYSPSSRIPCIDFSLWIKNNISRANYDEVINLVSKIIVANPGMGFDFNNGIVKGSTWYNNLYKIMSADLTQFIEFDNPEAYIELKTALVLLEIHNKTSNFSITDDVASTYVSSALCPYKIKKINIEKLSNSANSFIRKMKREEQEYDGTFWVNYELFNVKDLNNKFKALEYAPEEIRYNIKNLNLNSRSHLLDIISLTAKKGSVLIESSTFYPTRQMGIYIPDSINDLIALNFIIENKDPGAALDNLKKDDLIKICEENNVPYKKSWNKSNLISAIITDCPGAAKDISKNILSVTLNSNFKEYASAVLNQVYSSIIFYKILIGFSV